MNIFIELKNKLMWGVFLTFFMKSFLKFYVNTALGVSDDTKTQGERIIPFCLLIILTAAPFYMLTGLINMSGNFKRVDLNLKYGALTLNVRTDNPPCYLFNFFFILRRMIFALSLAFFASCPFFQFFTSLLLSLFHFLYV